MKVIRICEAFHFFDVIYDDSTVPWTLLTTECSLNWARERNKEIPNIFICGYSGDIKDIAGNIIFSSK